MKIDENENVQILNWKIETMAKMWNWQTDGEWKVVKEFSFQKTDISDTQNLGLKLKCWIEIKMLLKWNSISMEWKYHWNENVQLKWKCSAEKKKMIKIKMFKFLNSKLETVTKIWNRQTDRAWTIKECQNWHLIEMKPFLLFLGKGGGGL